jgi:exonuclease VII small subunit
MSSPHWLSSWRIPNSPLEQALALYESGMALAKSAQSALDSAEQRVRLINEQGEAESIES